MKTPKPITTTTTQSFFAQCRYVVVDRDRSWRDYRKRLLDPIDGCGQRYGIAYGTMQ